MAYALTFLAGFAVGCIYMLYKFMVSVQQERVMHKIKREITVRIMPHKMKDEQQIKEIAERLQYDCADAECN